MRGPNGEMWDDQTPEGSIENGDKGLETGDIDMSDKGSEVIEINDYDGVTTDKDDDKIVEDAQGPNLIAKESGEGSGKTPSQESTPMAVAPMVNRHPDFPDDLWDRLLLHAELALNVMRPWHPNPSLSAWSWSGLHHLPHDFAAHPFHPPGQLCLSFNGPDHHLS